MPSTVISLRVSKDQVVRLRRKARRLGRSPSETGALLLEEGLRRDEFAFIDFRESAVVGIVGGGGIGATLDTAFNRYEFDSAAAIILIIIAIVMAVEYSSGYLRRWVQ